MNWMLKQHLYIGSFQFYRLYHVLFGNLYNMSRKNPSRDHPQKSISWCNYITKTPLHVISQQLWIAWNSVTITNDLIIISKMRKHRFFFNYFNISINLAIWQDWTNIALINLTQDTIYIPFTHIKAARIPQAKCRFSSLCYLIEFRKFMINIGQTSCILMFVISSFIESYWQSTKQPWFSNTYLFLSLNLSFFFLFFLSFFLFFLRNTYWKWHLRLIYLNQT